MEKQNKTKGETEKAGCCSDKDSCSIECSPKSKKKESKCGCEGGCC